jgi:uncharacterized protein YecE (DUF72 family)
MAEGRLLVGTSGWSYDHWRGRFYPEHLAVSRRLGYYAKQFDTVEVNATFYGLPKKRTVESWREAVPPGFVFAVKGSRYITHMRKLENVAEPLARLMDRISPLGDTLGPLLWQLPPFLERDDDRLERFLDALPAGHRHAVEFRNETWLHADVFALLREHGVAVVNVSGEMLKTDLTTTADFVYVRFHGTVRYHGAYARPQLEPWAAFLRRHLRAGRDCYAYFNNDAEGHAPVDAERLVGMLARHPAEEPVRA